MGPIYRASGVLVPGDDGCPLPGPGRRFGHRTETLALALTLACTTGQVVFAPTFAARPFVERGALVEIAVRGWNVRAPLYLVCHQDRIRARVRRTILSAMQAAL